MKEGSHAIKILGTLKDTSHFLLINHLKTFLATLLIAGCINGGDIEFRTISFNTRLEKGDHHVSWSLNYFESWKNSHQPRYLNLAEFHSISAIEYFARLELDTSPRISEFYVVRERRTRACRLLAELQFEAGNHGHRLPGSTPLGCIY